MLNACLVPDAECLDLKFAIGTGCQKVPAGMEVAMDKCVNGEEILGMSR